MQFIPENRKLILGSKSPRRKQLLRDLGLDFEVRSKEVEENYPDHLRGEDIALFLAEKKARAFLPELADDEIVLTSDTVVWCNNTSLEKAGSADEAKVMLQTLSGTSHQVISAICLLSKSRMEIGNDITTVRFRDISEEEIDYYIETYKPFDKAGAYGIQEWIGMAAITSISGSYFTVVGLPTHLVLEKLRLFQ